MDLQYTFCFGLFFLPSWVLNPRSYIFEAKAPPPSYIQLIYFLWFFDHYFRMCIDTCKMCFNFSKWMSEWMNNVPWHCRVYPCVVYSHILNKFELTDEMRIAQRCFFFLPHPNEWFKDQNLITSLYRTKWIIRPSGYRLQRKGLQQSQEQEDLWSWSQRILNCGALELLQSHICFKSLLIGEVAQGTG